MISHRRSLTRTRSLAAAVAVTAVLGITACSSDDEGEDSATTTAAATTTTAAQIVLPTVEELGATLGRITDTAVATADKLDTVDGGDQSAELIDALAGAAQSTGTVLAAVDPVTAGATAESALATVTTALPDQEPVVVENLEFVHRDGVWKISRAAVCDLVGRITPDQIPPVCTGDAAADPNAEDPAAAAAVDPAPEVAAAPVGDPAIRDALLNAGVDQATADKLAENPDATVAAAVNMGIPQATADQFRSNPQGAIDSLRAAGIDPVTAAPQLAAQL